MSAEPAQASEPPPPGLPGLAPRRLEWRGLRERRLAMPLLASVGLLLALAWWHFAGRETTDDARIEGHVHPVAARVGGTVLAVHVIENQAVARGDVLWELDPIDYQVALSGAKADLLEAQARLRAAETGVPITSTSAHSELDSARAGRDNATTGVALAEQRLRVAQSGLAAAKAQLDEAQVRYTRAGKERERLARLIERDEVSQQRYDDAVADAAAAEAAVAALRAAADAAAGEVEIADSLLRQARGDLTRSEAGLASARTAPEQIAVILAEAASAQARLEQAEAALERARLDLEYAKVRAPATGRVSRKRVEVGQVVQAGQPLMAIVALDDVWTVANFKETQLRRMRPGQPARVKVDAYPGRTLRGRVESLGAATTSRFSLLPPENATGNFVKVVQRVPVKIALDAPPDAERPLRPGMSVVATVLTRGPVEAAEPLPAPAAPGGATETPSSRP